MSFMAPTPANHDGRLLRALLHSQTVTLFATGLVFPFYIVFISQTGASFTEFGIAYALFAVASALVHQRTGVWSDRIGRKPFLLAHNWVSAILFLLFPLVETMMHVYILQVCLGIVGAMHKTSEKAVLADATHPECRGEFIGGYHGWIAIASALAIMVGGFLIDLFSISVIFYVGSIILFFSGFIILKIPDSYGKKSV